MYKNQFTNYTKIVEKSQATIGFLFFSDESLWTSFTKHVQTFVLLSTTFFGCVIGLSKVPSKARLWRYTRQTPPDLFMMKVTTEL